MWLLVIDTVMDLTSKFIPFMQDPADWWDEQSGRKTETDLTRKQNGTCQQLLCPMLLGGGAISGATKAAGLTGKTKLGADCSTQLWSRCYHVCYI